MIETINEAWAVYAETVVPEDTTEDGMCEQKAAFHSGAMVAFKILVLDAHGRSAKDSIAAITLVCDQLDEYMAKAKAGL